MVKWWSAAREPLNIGFVLFPAGSVLETTQNCCYCCCCCCRWARECRCVTHFLASAPLAALSLSLSMLPHPLSLFFLFHLFNIIIIIFLNLHNRRSAVMKGISNRFPHCRERRASRFRPFLPFSIPLVRGRLVPSRPSTSARLRTANVTNARSC